MPVEPLDINTMGAIGIRAVNLMDRLRETVPGDIAAINGAMAGFDSAVADGEAAGSSSRFSGIATITRPGGAEEYDAETAEQISTGETMIGEYPASIDKAKSPKILKEGNGFETIADWEGQTTLDYNPEIGDIFTINGYRHVVKDSDEGKTDASFLTLWLVRSGRDNKGV